MTLGAGIVFGLLGIWFCYHLYIMMADRVFSELGKGEELVRYGTTLIETHYSGLMVDKTGSQSVSFSPGLTQKATLTLYKQVGKGQVVVGTVEVKKPLGGAFGYELRYERERLEDHNGTFSFTVPPELLGRPPLAGRKEQDRLWERLKQVEDGNVAEMAFSTLAPQKPEQMMQLLEKYDVILVQMPVYAGELQTFKTSSASSGQQTSVPHLNVRPAVTYEEEAEANQVASFQIYMDDVASAKDAASRLVSDLQWLQEHGKNGFAQYDAKRLDYLRKNGVTVYGAVVTGPVRELEKLRENPLLHDFHLGRIDVWNW